MRRGVINIEVNMNTISLVLGVSLVIGVVASQLSKRIGVPALVLFIGAGMLLGSDISGWIYFDNAAAAQTIGSIALVEILFQGGLETEWRKMKKVLLPSSVLATVGVVVTSLLTGLIAWWVLDIDWPMAMLIGSIVGSTDAAATFAVIGNSDLPARLKHTLESESGLNDPMAIFLTILMIEWVQIGTPSAPHAIGFLVLQMGLGVAAGLGAGWLMKRVIPRVRLEASGLYPILLTGVAFALFAAVSLLSGSGYMAVYILGIYLATLELPYRQSVFRFHEGMAWLAQIVMFTMLGLLVFPSDLGPITVPAMLIAAGQILIARPLAVWLGTLGMGFHWREYLVLAWAGLRGAVPVILATYPLVAGVPNSDMIFNVVFFVVLFSCVLQGSTISWVADKLGLLVRGGPPRPIRLELVAMEKLNADVLEVELHETSLATGRRLSEISLPEQVTISAIYRGGRVVIPRGGTRLEAGDVLFVLAPRDSSGRVESLLVGET